MEFVSAFEVPSSSVLNKDVAARDVGKPFSPLMFDGVLKNFTPDLPSGIVGRPRFVDAYTFSFQCLTHPWLWFNLSNVAIDTVVPFIFHNRP